MINNIAKNTTHIKTVYPYNSILQFQGYIFNYILTVCLLEQRHFLGKVGSYFEQFETSRHKLNHKT